MLRKFTSTSSSVSSLKYCCSLTAASATPLLFDSSRAIFADKVRAGNIVKDQGKYWRVVSNSRSQKGQGAASYHLKVSDVLSGKKKEFTSPANKDFPEARTERLKLLFSGFDDDDMACFVYPQHHNLAGQEINIPGTSLSDQLQKWLACGMPVDMLHIMGDDDEVVMTGGATTTDHYCDIMIPSNYVYTVERLGIKGMYKLAFFEECDGSVTVSDNVQIGDKVKVTLRNDGTAGFGGKA